ncbi:MAG TPA: outer membrane beta-barrel protein, partial [Thermoguttaceae bacterium]|nr:outer membrane beta-barrel protein [Thermoguttaceae bacterium]
MRIVTLALAALVLVAATWGAPASAETLTQPASVKQVTYFDDTDVADLKATETPAAIETSNAYRQAACCPEMCDPGCSPCNSLGFTTGGWLQAGITANSQDPQDRFNGPLMTDDRVGELEMNELWFYLERPIHTENGFDVGGRVDFLYGTDWRIVDCYGNGLEDRMNGPRNLYGVALPQMYVEAGVGDFSVKMGRMT